VTLPRGTTSNSEPGRSQVGGRSAKERTRATPGDDAIAPATEDLLDERERRQGRGRKKPGPTRTAPDDPPAPPADAPPTEL